MIYTASGGRRAPSPRTWLGLGAGLAAVLLMLGLIAAAWAQSGSRTAAADDRPGDAALASAGGGPAAGAGGAGGSDATGGAGDASGGDAPADAPASPPAPAPTPSTGPDDPAAEPDPAGPTIEYFQVTQQPQCPGGTTVHPVPAQPVTLEWKVSGADGDQVSLAIDGPGVYNTYPAVDSDTIAFPCEGEEGDVQEHTYLLTATGDGVTVSETVTVSAEVHETTDLTIIWPGG